MSPELETMDQLLGGELSLKVVRALYPDTDSFLRGVLGLLSCGDVGLETIGGSVVPEYRWRQLFADGTVLNELENLVLKITDQGARRIA